MADTIRISLELADKAAQQSLTDFINKADKADKGFKKVKDSGKDAFSEVSVHIGKALGVYDIFAGNLAANLVTKSFDTLMAAASRTFQVFVVDGVRAAEESENALNSLNVALAQSGEYSEESSAKFQEYAKQIQRTTAFEDDAVIKNAALLESMTAMSEQGLERSTSAAIELSAALGKDLESTTIAIAKAANGNTTALQKMGLQFTKGATEAQTFENALAAIEQKYGGTAASKLNTFSGAIEQTKNNFGDLQEEIGGLIITNPAVIASIQAISDILRGTSSNIAGNKDEFKLLIAQGLVTFIDVTKLVVQAANIMVTGVSVAFNSVVSVASRSMQLLFAPLARFSDYARNMWQAYRDQANESAKAVSDTINNEGSLGGTIKNLGKVGEAAEAAFTKMKTGADTASSAITNNKNKFKELSEDERKAQEETDKYVESLAKKSTSIKDNYDLQLEQLQAFYDQKNALDINNDIINYDSKLAREQSFYADKQVLLDENIAAELRKIDESNVSEATKNNARLAVQTKYYADTEKLQAEHSKKTQELEKAKHDYLIANQKSTLSTIATLTESGNVNLANIGKAAGIAQIAIDTPVAIAKALASAPPPINFGLAIAVGAAMAAQAAKIAGLSFEQGGIVPGSSFTGDNIKANVNSGEMILNRQQQANLFSMANGSSANNGLMQKIDAMLGLLYQVLAQPLVVNVDGRQLINITRDQLASGRSI